ISQALPDQATVDLTAFPAEFMWGAGGSAHQNEGGDVDSDWWVWENAGRTESGDVSGMAADQYHRYEEDFDRLLALNMDTCRLSLSWARLFPREDMTSPEPNAVAHYDAVFAALARRKIRPIVTLLHFSSPRCVTDQDRWVSGAALGDFKQYVRFAA